MKAVILAAGVGSRLKELTKDIPKCLLKLDNSTSILDYQISTLIKIANLDYTDIYVIGGYKFETLKYLEKGINLIFNSKYKEWNNIYSFYLIKKNVSDNFYLLNGDTIYHPDILKNLVNTDNNTYFVVDNVKKLAEEEMKVLIENSRILKFGKNIQPEKANGEYIGLAKFNKEDANVIFNIMDELINKGNTDIWYESAINNALNKIMAKPIYTNGLPWIEIDNREDYERGKEIFKLIGGKK
jgi:choline kinase